MLTMFSTPTQSRLNVQKLLKPSLIRDVRRGVCSCSALLNKVMHRLFPDPGPPVLHILNSSEINNILRFGERVVTFCVA